MSKFIDFHTHKLYKDPEVFAVRSLLLKDTVDYEYNDYFTIGCHPWYVDYYEKNKSALIRACKDPHCLAIGEIGLDRAQGLWNKQIDVFIEQVTLAQKFNKPIVIHCVRAYDQLLRFRKDYPYQTWIVHGFNGSLELAGQLIRHDIYLSIGKALLNEKSKIYRALEEMPRDYIFLETDDAQIHIKDIYFAAANILNIELEHLQSIINQNFKRIFDVTVE